MAHSYGFICRKTEIEMKAIVDVAGGVAVCRNICGHPHGAISKIVTFRQTNDKECIAERVTSFRRKGTQVIVAEKRIIIITATKDNTTKFVNIS